MIFLLLHIQANIKLIFQLSWIDNFIDKKLLKIFQMKNMLYTMCITHNFFSFYISILNRMPLFDFWHLH